MKISRPDSSGALAILVVGIVIGVSSPAIAHDARSAAHKISGSSIKTHSIAGNRLKSNTLTGDQIKESTLGTVPSATRASTLPALVWHPLTLLVGWANEFAAAPPVAYAVDAQGIVHLRGSVRGVSSTATEVIFDLPVSVRPSYNVYLPVVNNGPIPGTLIVESSGDVIDGHTAEQVFISLDGLTWAK
jgi:hypothetical protein